MHWRLAHTDDGMVIDNGDGKTLGYDPNSGIKIIEQDGYAFKDLDESGYLEPFEDWRLPISLRVRDFSTRFGLWQENQTLYYSKGTIVLSDDILSMMKKFREEDMKNYIDPQWDDIEYLNENDIVMVLLLMFDASDDHSKDSYLASIIVQSMHLGVFENIMYSIWNAIHKFINKETEMNSAKKSKTYASRMIV